VNSSRLDITTGSTGKPSNAWLLQTCNDSVNRVGENVMNYIKNSIYTCMFLWKFIMFSFYFWNRDEKMFVLGGMMVILQGQRIRRQSWHKNVFSVIWTSLYNNYMYTIELKNNIVEKIKTPILYWITLFGKTCRLWDNVEKYFRSGHRWQYSTVHAHCMLNT